MPTATDAHSPAPPPAAFEENRCVLVVDDENAVRDLISRWLESGGLPVMTAASADEALGRFQAAQPAVALCDIRMPGHDGLWLAERIRAQYPETAVIMATGVQEVAPAVQSLRQGVIDYLTKPFGRDRLREAVARGLDWHRAAWDARRWRESLEQEMDIRHARISAAITALGIESDEGLDAMLSMLTLTDRDAYAHAYRVAALTVSVARIMGLQGAALSAAERGALLHDIGKLVLPDAIVRKPAPLSEEERVLVRMHPAIGSELAAQVPYLSGAADIVRDAHERMDGLGYPRGIRAGDLPLGARIVSVANAYDTMTRPRVFRSAITAGEAILELERCSGTQFDGAVVAAFRQVVAGQ